MSPFHSKILMPCTLLPTQWPWLNTLKKHADIHSASLILKTPWTWDVDTSAASSASIHCRRRLAEMEFCAAAAPRFLRRMTSGPIASLASWCQRPRTWSPSWELYCRWTHEYKSSKIRWKFQGKTCVCPTPNPLGPGRSNISKLSNKCGISNISAPETFILAQQQLSLPLRLSPSTGFLKKHNS